MTTRNDGGPAFPSVLYSHERAENWSTDGMSLRDWFAGQALAGLISRAIGVSEITNKTIEAAWDTADAMIAERSK
jgi:hypothetical protein